MAFGDLHKVNLVGTLHGQTVMNALYYFDLGPAGGVADLISTLSTSTFQTHWLAPLSDDYSLDRYDGQTSSGGVLSFVFTQTAGIAGAVANFACPSEVAVVIRKRTALAGRKYRGRWYVPGIPFINTLESQIDPAQLAAWNTLSGDLETTIMSVAGNSYQPTLVPLWKNGVLPAGQPLTICVVDPILRSQRRRQIGRGI